MKTSKTFFYLLALPLTVITNPVLSEDKLDKIKVISDSQNERRVNQEQMFYKPYSKQVIGQKTIEEENIPDIAEAVRDVPGVTVTERGSFSKTIKIRGLQGSRVATLVDGIKLSNQGQNHTGAGETGMVDISNTKSIEVIKGSPAVIYDPGASGGVINVITHRAPLEKGYGFKQKISYDEGYDKKKTTTIIDASTGKIGGRFSYSLTNSNDYKIKGDEDKEYIIAKFNDLNQDSESTIKVDNLGYDSEAANLRLSAKVGSDGIIDIDWENFTGKDMVLVHGVAIRDALLIHYQRMDRNLQAISYRKENLAGLSNFHIKYAKQYQLQKIGTVGQGVILNSEQLNLITDLELNNFIFKFGGEVIFDDADNQIYSTQDYQGLFANAEYLADSWTFFGGLRANRWTTTQRLQDGTNQDVANQLVGISGITPPKETIHPTMALGAQYSINDQNNISFNLNTTFRNPSLMDRYSFGAVMGGGINMKPEEGKHAEIAWKYLDNNLSITSSVFYSQFKNYIWVRSKRQYKPGGVAALQVCRDAGLCTPEEPFNKTPGKFFNIFALYYNSKYVENRGAEIQALYTVPQHEITFGSSFNEINSDDVHVKNAAHPVDTNISYRYEINNSWKPWVKIKGQYVIDFPKVEQYKGFNPYSLFSLYAGFKKNGFVASAGIRNIMDTEYRAPYSGINGLSRTFFVNLSYDWHS